MPEPQDYPKWGPPSSIEVIDPHEPVPDPSWAVACPTCQAPRMEPCYRRNGTRSTVQHGQRWRAYDLAVERGRNRANAAAGEAGR